MIADEYYNDVDEYIDKYYGNVIIRIPMIVLGILYKVIMN